MMVYLRLFLGVDLTFDYDSKDRLLAAQNGTNTMAVTYDHQNRQVRRTHSTGSGSATTYFIYDGWSLIEERDATGALVQKYVHGAQIDERGSRQRQKAEPAGGDTAWGKGTWPEILWKQNTAGEVYYHQDGLGSTIALTDETGAIVESYQYDAFGTVSIYDASNTAISATLRENRFLFTGREWIGEIGLYDYRNRAYSPELGRFLQTDPIRFDAGDVNLYRYVGNGTHIKRDPLGLKEKCCCGPQVGNWVGSIKYSFRAFIVQNGSFEGTLTCDCKPSLVASVSGSVNGLLLVGFSSGDVQISVQAKEKSALIGKAGPLISLGVSIGVGPVGIGGSADLSESPEGGLKVNPNLGIGVDLENANPKNPGAGFGASLLFWVILSAE